MTKISAGGYDRVFMLTGAGIGAESGLPSLSARRTALASEPLRNQPIHQRH